jgi:inorganic triphosphatase YgiF
MDVTGVSVEREIAKLDRKIDRAQEVVDDLKAARQTLYQQLIDDAEQALAALQAKAGIRRMSANPGNTGKSQRPRPRHLVNHTGAGYRALTNDQVLDARARHAAGATAYRLSRDLGISAPAMTKLLRGETYKDVTP